MTFKIKSGLQVGSTTVVDQNSYFQQTESAAVVTPSLNLDFTTKTIDPRFTYTRASSGSYFDSDGFLKQAATNVPRFDHDPLTKICKGLLFEDTRTNLRQFSSYLGNYSGNALYGLGTATRGMDSAVLAPDGVSATCKITSTGGAFSRIDSSHSLNTGYYTFSFFAKANSAGFVYGTIENYPTQIVRFWGNLTTGASGYGISAGTIGVATSMVQYPNGWWRYIITVNIPSALTYSVYLGPSGSFGSNMSTLGDSINVWGDQLEVGNFPSGYIPNTKTFTSRASTGRIYRNDGYLSSVGTNVARLSYNPTNLNIPPTQLFEDTATNLLIWSEDFTNSAAWVPGPATPVIAGNQTAAPDGTTTADKFTRASSAVSNYVTQNYVKATSAITYTFSVYVKKSVGNYCSLRTQGLYPSRADVVFDISVGNATSGTIVSAAGATSSFTNPYASIVYVGLGWYRVSLTATSDTTVNYTCVISFSTQIAVVDGADSASNSAGFMWGAQLETGDTYTSYINTTGSTATRAADIFTAPTTTRSYDNLYIQNPTFGKYWNQKEGTIVTQFYYPRVNIPQDNYPIIYYVGGAPGNQISLYGNGNGSGSGTPKITNYGLILNSVQQSDYNDFSLNVGLNKTAQSWRANSSLLIGNGITTTEDTSVAVPYLTYLNIGGAGNGSNWNDTIASFTYYPKRLDNQTLLNLTTS